MEKERKRVMMMTKISERIERKISGRERERERKKEQERERVIRKPKSNSFKI